MLFYLLDVWRLISGISTTNFHQDFLVHKNDKDSEQK